MKFSILFATLLSVFSAQSAQAIFQPNRFEHDWKVNYVGETRLDGIPVIATLEELPAEVVVLTGQQDPFLGNAIIRPNTQKFYRLVLRTPQKPVIEVFFSLTRKEFKHEGRALVVYESGKSNSADFRFQINGEEGSALNVSYLRHQGGTLFETGTFSLEPALVITRQ